jgi:hypothetical protein
MAPDTCSAAQIAGRCWKSEWWYHSVTARRFRIPDGKLWCRRLIFSQRIRFPKSARRNARRHPGHVTSFVSENFRKTGSLAGCRCRAWSCRWNVVSQWSVTWRCRIASTVKDYTFCQSPPKCFCLQ